MKCDYCKSNEGKYKFKNGKICCEKNIAKCPSTKNKLSDKLKFFNHINYVAPEEFRRAIDLEIEKQADREALARVRSVRHNTGGYLQAEERHIGHDTNRMIRRYPR